MMNKIDEQINKIISCIINNNHQRVILQMPDDMLRESLNIKNNIEQQLKNQKIDDCEIILAADK